MKNLMGILMLITAVSFSNGLMAKEKFLLIDILVLNNGKTIEDAQSYFEQVEPIFKKYRMVRSDAVLSTVQIARGDLSAEVINLWETEDPQAAFKGIFSDKHYEKFVPLREAIFDMSKATVIVTERK